MARDGEIWVVGHHLEGDFPGGTADLDYRFALDGERIDHLQGEVAWAARHELALSIDDVLARRMRLAQELPDRGAAIAPRVAAILAAELGWGEARQTAEVDRYLETARREYGLPWATTG